MDADSGDSAARTAMAILKALARDLADRGVITADEWAAAVDDAIARASELPNAIEVIAALRAIRQTGL